MDETTIVFPHPTAAPAEGGNVPTDVARVRPLVREILLHCVGALVGIVFVWLTLPWVLRGMILYWEWALL